MRYWLTYSIVACALAMAQAPEGARPASTNVQNAQYPLVHTDRRVTFQLKAPEAHQVQVRVGQTYDMTKTADGTWSVTTPPLVVGFHYYSFVVDVAVNDPGSETFFGGGRESSGIEIPSRAWITTT